MAGATGALCEEVARARETPSGLSRISCPQMLLQNGDRALLPLFLEKNPECPELRIETTNKGEHRGEI